MDEWHVLEQSCSTERMKWVDCGSKLTEQKERRERIYDKEASYSPFNSVDTELAQSKYKIEDNLLLLELV